MAGPLHVKVPSDEVLKVDASGLSRSGAHASDQIPEAFRPFDDLRVVANDLRNDDAFTATMIVRNEMYFLPALLSHYRALGVERFVVLDDKSDDGTREFLADQDDCVILASDRRFGEPVVVDHPLARGGKTRVLDMWTNILRHRFARDRWSLHIDADEFIRLPEEMRFQDLIARLETSDASFVWAVMIDLYPPKMEDLKVSRGKTQFDPDAGWHYDACPHLRIRRGRAPKTVYPGSRARLMANYGVRSLKGFKAIRSLFALPHYNLLRKAPLMKIPAEGYMRNIHTPSMKFASDLLLPIEHFKFTSQLYERTKAAIETGSHHNNSSEYRDMAQLLSAMEKSAGSFLCPWSSKDRSFAAYRRAGLAVGI